MLAGLMADPSGRLTLFEPASLPMQLLWGFRPDTAVAQHTRHESTASLSDHERPGVSDLQKLTALMTAS